MYLIVICDNSWRDFIPCLISRFVNIKYYTGEGTLYGHALVLNDGLCSNLPALLVYLSFSLSKKFLYLKLLFLCFKHVSLFLPNLLRYNLNPFFPQKNVSNFTVLSFCWLCCLVLQEKAKKQFCPLPLRLYQALTLCCGSFLN